MTITLLLCHFDNQEGSKCLQNIGNFNHSDMAQYLGDHNKNDELSL